MPLTRANKEDIVNKLADKIARAQALVFLRFRGLSVAKAQELRRMLRELEADYTVAKKTLLGIALKENNKEISDTLEGEIGMVAAYGDELGVFKGAVTFAKKEKEALHISGGFYEGKFVDAATARALGSIPSREALLAQLMSVIQGNTRKFVVLLDQLARKGQ